MRYCLAWIFVLGLCQLRAAEACAQEKAAGRPALVVQTGHSGKVDCVAFSADGKWLITGGDDDSARLWEAATGREVRVFRMPPPNVAFPDRFKQTVLAAALSADGKHVAVLSTHAAPPNVFGPKMPGNAARVFDTATGKMLHAVTLSNDDGKFGDISFSSDGKNVAIVSGGAWVWQLGSGKLVGPYGDELRCAVLSRDGKRLIWGDVRDAMMIDWAADKLIRKFEGHSGRVTCLALSADEKWLLTGSEDSKLRQWDLAGGKLIRTFSGHEKGIVALGISSDGKLLVSAGGDNTVRVWDLESGTLVRLLKDFPRLLQAAALSADGKWLATVEGDAPDPIIAFGTRVARAGLVRLWDVAAAKEVRVFQRHNLELRAMTISSDGAMLATGCTDETARLWDLSSGKQVGVFPGHEVEVVSVAIGGDKKWLATVESQVRRGAYRAEETVSRVWEIATGNVVRELIGVNHLALSARENWLAYNQVTGRAGANDERQMLHAFDLTGKNKASFEKETFSFNMAFSPDGTRLAVELRPVVKGGNPVILWNPQTGEEIGAVNDDPNESSSLDVLRSMDFSHDGAWLVLGHRRHVRIWDVNRRTVVHNFRPGDDRNGNIVAALSSDKKWLAALVDERSVAVWELATRKRLGIFPQKIPASRWIAPEQRRQGAVRVRP